MSNRVVCHFDLNSIALLLTNRGHKTVLLEAKMKTLKPNSYFKVHYRSYNAGFDCKKGHSSTHIQLYMIVSVVIVSGGKSGHLVKILHPFFQMCLGQMQQQHIQSMTNHLINVSIRLQTISIWQHSIIEIAKLNASLNISQRNRVCIFKLLKNKKADSLYTFLAKKVTHVNIQLNHLKLASFQ